MTTTVKLWWELEGLGSNIKHETRIPEAQLHWPSWCIRITSAKLKPRPFNSFAFTCLLLHSCTVNSVSPCGTLLMCTKWKAHINLDFGSLDRYELSDSLLLSLAMTDLVALITHGECVCLKTSFGHILGYIKIRMDCGYVVNECPHS